MKTQTTVKDNGDTATNFEFVVSSASSKPSSADRKRIRSHVLRARTRRDNRPVQKPWVNPDLPQLPKVGPMLGFLERIATVPKSICPDLALVHFPEQVNTYVLRNLFDCKSTPRCTGLDRFPDTYTD